MDSVSGLSSACTSMRQCVLVPRKIGELELDFENPTWKSNWDFEEFTVRFIVKFESWSWILKKKKKKGGRKGKEKEKGKRD